MNYKELIYKNALCEIERIYHDSKYNPNTDLYRSLDLITATNDAQIASKEWLVNTLVDYLNPKYLTFELRDVLIMGGWYGLTGMILRQQIDREVKIWNVDSDPECAHFQHMLQWNNPDYEHNIPVTDDAIEYYFDRADAFQLIINTSCEHMEQDDIQMILKSKPIDTIACFQSNNYHKEPEHINTHDSLDSFVDSLDLTHVYYKGEMNPSEDYTRYMVIGI
jgi:hypothetical protein